MPSLLTLTRPTSSTIMPLSGSAFLMCALATSSLGSTWSAHELSEAGVGAHLKVLHIRRGTCKLHWGLGTRHLNSQKNQKFPKPCTRRPLQSSSSKARRGCWGVAAPSFLFALQSHEESLVSTMAFPESSHRPQTKTTSATPPSYTFCQSNFRYFVQKARLPNILPTRPM